MTEKENQRTKLTKLLLKKSIIELMHHKTVNKITIKELCENADINRSTFYSHYADQYMLLEDIEAELIVNLENYLLKVDIKADSIQYLNAFLSYIYSHNDILGLLLCNPDNHAFQKHFIDIALHHIQSVVVLKCPPELKSYIYQFLLMGCLSIIQQWITNNFDMTSQDVAVLIFNLSDRSIKEYI